MRILSIIVSYNGIRWIRTCLQSLLDSDLQSDILVIDNGSTDGTRELIAAEFPAVELIIAPANLGFGGGNNLGFRRALDGGYDYVYLLNQDAWVETDTLSSLVKAMQLRPEFGLLSPIQTDASGSRLDQRFAEKVSLQTGRVAQAEELEVIAEDMAAVPMPFVMAAHWLISRECLETVGGFAPLFSHNGEDDNYCDRVRYHAFRLGFSPRAKAVHDRADRPLSRGQRLRLSCLTGNLARLCNINHPLWERCIWIVLFSIWKCLKERSFRPLQYLIPVFKRWPEVLQTRKASRQAGAYLT